MGALTGADRFPTTLTSETTLHYECSGGMVPINNHCLGQKAIFGKRNCITAHARPAIERLIGF